MNYHKQKLCICYEPFNTDEPIEPKNACVLFARSESPCTGHHSMKQWFIETKGISIALYFQDFHHHAPTRIFPLHYNVQILLFFFSSLSQIDFVLFL